jgi:ADP-dependent NAD(P)H-hydrate dehydratase / NAD(P)H-hydrate epimerase
MKLLTAAQSRELDRLSQERHAIASYSLMTRAGEAVAEAAARRWPERINAGVLVVAGRGNNGGDGMVAARRMADSGMLVRVILLGSIGELRGDARRAYEDWVTADRRVVEATSQQAVSSAFADRAGIIIDAIFGTGLNAEVKGLARYAVEQINRAAAAVTAVDIASGVNADSGAIMGAAVEAGLTVTFGAAKFGHVSYPGAAHCGALEVADVGFAPAALAELGATGCYLEVAEVAPLVKPRIANAHKGSYGHPLIVAGSRGKAGAALLASRGALRMGAGLVTAAIPESVAAIVAAGQAELMTESMPELNGHFDGARTIDRLAALAPSMTALVVGPGIGVSHGTRELIAWLTDNPASSHLPMVLDADGLNLLAQLEPARLKRSSRPVILTPHPGEMARLLGSTTAEVNADRISSALRLAGLTGAHVLLKGNRSVIATPSGELCVNSSGNPGMATAGMGDALSGMLGALLGQGRDPLEALKLGVFLHGFAGDRLAVRRGPVGYLAGDVIDELPAAMAALRA